MRVTIYDKTPGTGFMQWCLKTSWLIGCWLQKLFGAIDDYHGVSSLYEINTWLKSKKTTFSSVQYWGHGSPGVIWISGTPTFSTDWMFIRPLLTKESILWFRICSLFQGEDGQAISRKLADGLNCTIAGHTRIIGLWQGGLYTRKPYSLPSWPLAEGSESSWIRDDFRFWEKHTISCLRTTIPEGW